MPSPIPSLELFPFLLTFVYDFFYINSLRKKKILIRLVDGRLLGGRASTNDRAELLPNFCYIFLISSIKANTAIFNTSYVQIFFQICLKSKIFNSLSNNLVFE